MWPFKKKEKLVESKNELEQFNSDMTKAFYHAQGNILQMSFTINDLDTQIEELLKSRQSLVTERLALTLIVNKQREAFGWEPVDLDAIDNPEPDSDDSALE